MAPKRRLIEVGSILDPISGANSRRDTAYHISSRFESMYTWVISSTKPSETSTLATTKPLFDFGSCFRYAMEYTPGRKIGLSPLEHFHNSSLVQRLLYSTRFFLC